MKVNHNKHRVDDKRQTLSEMLRCELQAIGDDGRTNAQTIVQALIDKARSGDVEAISAVLDRSRISVKIVIELGPEVEPA